MKENKGKDVVSKGKRPQAQPQDQPKVQTQGHPTARDKKKESPYQKTLIYKGSPIVKTKE